MSTLAQILDQPIRWRDWESDAELLAFLSDLQANILKGHGRDHTANVFVSFATMPRADIAALLQKLSFLTTSALDQLRSAEAFKATRVSGGRVVCVFLGRGAYAKMGATPDAAPADAAFRQGMRARGRIPTLRFENIPVDFPGLNDPAPSQWEQAGAWSPKKPEPDAMILIADDTCDLVADGVAALCEVVEASGGDVLGVDLGLAQRRRQVGGDPKGEGIEHFGYVDGRSQPLFLAEDLLTEPQTAWSAEFKPSQFVVPDPAECTPFSCGSYFVYRKLEQDVAAFKRQEAELAAALDLSGEDAERAGALVVGRFEDGTPVIEGDPIAGHPVNDFKYDDPDDDDPLATRCPFKAHIRKTNPRGDGEGERGRLMARRGITYGQRRPRPEGADFPEDDRPSKGVGLLFMAYMANVSEQFEFTQAAWAGNGDFEKPHTGIDAVIGQRTNRPGTPDMDWFDKRSGRTAKFDFNTSIHLVGGEYFFAPSISFLQRGPAPATV